MCSPLRVALFILGLLTVLPSVRAQAPSGAPPNLDVLTALVESLDPAREPRWDVRRWAAEGLGTLTPLVLSNFNALGQPQPKQVQDLVVPPLRARAKDPGEQPMVRAAAIKSLGQIGPTAGAALADLPRLIADGNWLIRTSAAEALERVGRGMALEGLADVLGLLQDPRYDVRRLTAEALGGIGAGTPALLPTIEAALRPRLGDPEPWVRSSAAEALARTNAPEAVVPLSEMLRTERHPGVQRTVAGILGNIGAQFREGPATAAIRKDGVPALCSLLWDCDPQTRAAAVMSLGDLGAAARDAVPQLRRVLRTDWATSVRDEAVRALAKIEIQDVRPIVPAPPPPKEEAGEKT
jgi:HEAT repeat protein